MSIPDAVTMRLQAYTLACRALLSRYSDLQQATLAHPQLTGERCIELFDKALRDYFNGDTSDDVSHASEQLRERLQTEANAFRRRNANAAGIFDAVIAEMDAQANAWDYMQDVETFHAQGRAMARNYFAASQAPDTRQRLETLCRLNHAYTAGKSSGVPMSYRQEEQEITVRFALDYGFTDYLALPYQFLHEYTAHVYALDNDRNPLFNDGWMLYAAQAFFQRLTNSYPPQTGIFFEYLYPRLNSDAKAFTRFAQDFDAWLDRSRNDTFQRITYELAAFEPIPQQPDWINTFLLALYQEFTYGDRAALNKVIYSDAVRYPLRDLGRYLWQCRHVADYFSVYQSDVEGL